MDNRLFIVFLSLLPFCHCLGEAAIEVWPILLVICISAVCLCCIVCISERFDWEQAEPKMKRTRVVKGHKEEKLMNDDGTVQQVTDTSKTRKEEYDVEIGSWYEYDESAYVTDQYKNTHRSQLREAF